MRVYRDPSDPTRRRRMGIANRLLERMEDLGLTTYSLATKVGVSQASASDWLNPKILAEPSALHLLRLSVVLHCSMEWLLTGRE